MAVKLLEMGLMWIALGVLLGGVSGKNYARPMKESGEPIVSLEDTELVQVFVIFRHGDRTPDPRELMLYNTSSPLNEKIFFPFGLKALTNKGKQNAFLIGSYLRESYDGFISRLYLPDEILVRSTDMDRTKMTALLVMAAMYPPLPSQQWSPYLAWQPVPYYALPAKDDDLQYWSNCPRYQFSRNKTILSPEVQNWMKPYRGLMKYVSEKTERNITDTRDVYFLYSLYEALSNVGVDPPAWAQKVMPEMQAVTNIEYALDFHTDDLIRCSTGLLMNYILRATNASIASEGQNVRPKLQLISAHEINVAALMAASRVFHKPHQPHYGATFSLELRRHKPTGVYGMTAVYAPNPGGPGIILHIAGCKSKVFCEYETFVNLVKNVAWSRREMIKGCHVLT